MQTLSAEVKSIGCKGGWSAKLTEFTTAHFQALSDSVLFGADEDDNVEVRLVFTF